jgi:DNA-binding GntR family transcriptional regulator
MKETVIPASLASEAYDFVKQRILRGELPMGQVISRRKIAAELGMSFLPVSEALLRLEFEGLLESRPRAGTRVRIPSREDVRGHYIVREALEVQAARLFATVASAEDRSELQKLAARVDTMSSSSDQSLYLSLHEKLHRRIADGARCPALSQAIEKTHALASTWYCVAPELTDQEPARPHQQLVEVLVIGQPDEAAEAMRVHVNRGMQNTMERLKPYFRIRKAFGRTYYRSEKRQKQQLVDPSAWN